MEFQVEEGGASEGVLCIDRYFAVLREVATNEFRENITQMRVPETRKLFSLTIRG